jgi:DNA invertase Pin-like site-specific DNA recombinase
MEPLSNAVLRRQGQAPIQLTGAFAEFERSMIRQRVRAGLKTLKATIARDGKFTSKAGEVRH